MASVTTTLEMHRGDGRVIEVVLTLNGAAWNVPADAAVRSTGKQGTGYIDANAVWVKTVGNGVTFANNVVSIALVAGDTSGLGRTETLVCDVQVTPNGGQPMTVVWFLLLVSADVSITVP